MGTPPIKVGQAKLKLDRQSSNSGQAKFQFWTRQSPKVGQAKKLKFWTIALLAFIMEW